MTDPDYESYADYREDDEPMTCNMCQGSGEGRWGGRCVYCKGGVIYPEPDPYDDPRIDWEMEER